MIRKHLSVKRHEYNSMRRENSDILSGARHGKIAASKGNELTHNYPKHTGNNY